jgi:hypothetical protein
MLIKKILLKVIVSFVLMIPYEMTLTPQEKNVSLIASVMFYNVENLFDTTDDPKTDDDDFLPSGLMRWNKTRYNHKINLIGKTIIAAGGWEPPVIIGFCEIENRGVIEDLIYRTSLSYYGYGIVHNDSPDPRGIDVCMIYRKDKVKVLDNRSLIPSDLNSGDFHSRSVLLSKCVLMDDTLFLMINHWPSRRGGVLAAQETRKYIAVMIKNVVDSLVYTTSGSAKIIIMGDLNCTPHDSVLKLLLNQAGNDSVTLVNLSGRSVPKSSGTYKFQGSWELIDHIIISDNLLECSKGLYTEINNFRIFKPDFLMQQDGKYPGLKPFSTYYGYHYQGGYSDHLPVLLDLRVK